MPPPLAPRKVSLGMPSADACTDDAPPLVPRSAAGLPSDVPSLPPRPRMGLGTASHELADASSTDDHVTMFKRRDMPPVPEPDLPDVIQPRKLLKQPSLGANAAQFQALNSELAKSRPTSGPNLDDAPELPPLRAPPIHIRAVPVPEPAVNPVPLPPKPGARAPMPPPGDARPPLPSRVAPDLSPPSSMHPPLPARMPAVEPVAMRPPMDLPAPLPPKPAALGSPLPTVAAKPPYMAMSMPTMPQTQTPLSPVLQPKFAPPPVPAPAAGPIPRAADKLAELEAMAQALVHRDLSRQVRITSLRCHQ